MTDLNFKCFRCSRFSEFNITSDNNDEMKRFSASGKDRGTVRFICTECGTANEIEIDLATATQLLERVSSDDPEIQHAIDRAKEGDYGSALDLARKKLGF